MEAYPKGWYPSPNVEGRDQWWNGAEWTAHTQLTTSPADSGVAVPPAGSVRTGVGSATLPTAIIAIVVGFASVFGNPFFILSLVAFLLGGAAVSSIRNTPEPGTRTAVIIVGGTAIALGLAGAIVYVIGLLT